MYRRSAGARSAALGSLLAIGLAVSGFSGVAGAATPEHYYLDCAAGSDAAPGTTPTQPWQTLDKVNSVTFGPGDMISLRRGTTCRGTLTPQGSGTSAAPIVVNPYGSGAQPKIVADHARAAVSLRNVQGWELRELDITNSGAAGSARIGIHVELDDFGIGHHFVLDSVRVHDVNGCDCTFFGEPSGGIVFDARGSVTPTGFDGVRVSNSTVTHVDGLGIGTVSLWGRRDVFAPNGPGSTWVPMTGVLVDNNRLADLGGDGIVIQNGSDALVQSNVVDGFSLRADFYHAGIWAVNSDRTIIQHNEIAHGDGSLPAEAFDVDGGNNGITYQHNNTHHNNGGMMLACADPDLYTRGAVVRNNTSYDDRDGAGGVLTLVCAPQDDFTFAGNSVTAPAAATIIKNVSGTSVDFSLNVFTGRLAGSVIDDPYSVFTGNVFTNIIDPPTQTTQTTQDQ